MGVHKKRVPMTMTKAYQLLGCALGVFLCSSGGRTFANPVDCTVAPMAQPILVLTETAFAAGYKWDGSVDAPSLVVYDSGVIVETYVFAGTPGCIVIQPRSQLADALQKIRNLTLPPAVELADTHGNGLALQVRANGRSWSTSFPNAGFGDMIRRGPQRIRDLLVALSVNPRTAWAGSEILLSLSASPGKTHATDWPSSWPVPKEDERHPKQRSAKVSSREWDQVVSLARNGARLDGATWNVYFRRLHASEELAKLQWKGCPSADPPN
jgi:hypothetical protein